ncbi:MAG: FHA domain-containing protein [Isosphaeraceae bacterium]|nr:FHA domain-containing protein [Isosphaeraceae bacterium]
MPSQPNELGVLKPLGGGDPVPLLKTELVVGRRASCDVCLDFTNVSGKHCQLRLIHGVWHVRDLGSTNGTTVNGAAITSDHVLMPDDEFGVAGHLFHLEYEPSGPEAMHRTKEVIDEEMLEDRKKTSLLELAGLDTDGDKPKRPRRATRAPEIIERLSADEAEFDDALPEHVKAAPAPKVDASDDDFFKLIEESVEKPKP